MIDARNGIHAVHVDRHDATAAVGRAHPLGGDLRPAARCGAKVDDFLAGFEQMILVVDLDQLEGGARTIALAPGFGDIGVVELALEPRLGRDGAPLRRS